MSKEIEIKSNGEITIRFELSDMGEVDHVPEDVEQKILDYFIEIMFEEGVFDFVEVIDSRINFER